MASFTMKYFEIYVRFKKRLYICNKMQDYEERE